MKFLWHNIPTIWSPEGATPCIAFDTWHNSWCQLFNGVWMESIWPCTDNIESCTKCFPAKVHLSYNKGPLWFGNAILRQRIIRDSENYSWTLTIVSGGWCPNHIQAQSNKFLQCFDSPQLHSEKVKLHGFSKTPKNCNDGISSSAHTSRTCNTTSWRGRYGQGGFEKGPPFPLQ